MIKAEDFREFWPEFSDKDVYSIGAVNFWGAIASKMLSSTRYGSLLDHAIALFIAHNLVLEKQAQDVAKNGGDPGVKVGVLASMSVGDVSVTYDATTGTDPADGHWAKTIYGRRLLVLMDMAGAGPVQVNGCNVSAPFSGQGWQGPPPWPGWFSS